MRKYIIPALLVFLMGGIAGSIGLGVATAIGTSPIGYGGDPPIFPELSDGPASGDYELAAFYGFTDPLAASGVSPALVPSGIDPATIPTGSGTDNHVVRWDGTGNIQDSDFEIADSFGGMTIDSGTQKAVVRVNGFDVHPSASGTGVFLSYVYGDTQPMFGIRGDGQLTWGPGGATGGDAQLSRLAANLLSLGTGDAFVIGSTAGNHASTTEGTISYDSVSDTFEGYANGAWVTLGSTGGGYTTVEDEGTPLTARTTMNFVGAGVTATDAGGKTVVTIPGGGGFTDWDMDADTGTAEAVADGEIGNWLGSDGLDSTVSATRTITYGLDLEELTADSDIDVTNDEIPYADVSGNDNNTITLTEAIWETPIRRHPLVYEEFCNVPATALTTYWNGLGYLTVNGASASIIGVAGTADHPGVAAIRTGTATTGRAALMGSNVGVVLGGGEWHFLEINLIAVAGDATDNYTVRLGFGDNDAGEPTDGVYFRYNYNVNGGEWQAVTRAAGVETGSATDTNVALDTANFVKFEIIVNAGATSVDFKINGTTVATNTTNIPSASTGILVGSIIKSAGSGSRQVQIDTAGVHHTLTNRR